MLNNHQSSYLALNRNQGLSEAMMNPTDPTDAGILQPQQQQEGCNADHKAQRRMNCSKLIAAHSGGNAESNAVKENDMPEE